MDMTADAFEGLAGGIMHSISYTRAESTRNRRFRACFGTSALICVKLWTVCVDGGRLPQGAMPHHLLWALMFLKLYAVEEVHASHAGCDEKTFRDWVWAILHVIASIDHVVSTTARATPTINLWCRTLSLVGHC